MSSPSIACPIPAPVTRQQADRMYVKVRKELHGLGPDAYKREAARRLGIDVNQFNTLRSNKGLAKAKSGAPKPLDPKVKLTQPANLQGTRNSMTGT